MAGERRATLLRRSSRLRCYTMKPRLDEILISLGHADTIGDARGLIMSGVVLVDGAVVDKPGTRLREHANVTLRRTAERFLRASRAGTKLETALDTFSVVVAGATVLDAGAAAGGFTEVLLRRGAARVYAVDAGHGQLRGRLAADARVINREKTNVGTLRPHDFDDALDLCTVDLSYLSLTKAIPQLVRVFDRTPPRLVCLVKPLYEGVSQTTTRQSVAQHRSVLKAIVDVAAHSGVGAARVAASPIRGSRGAVEYLLMLEPGNSENASQDIQEAVESARLAASERLFDDLSDER